jgi:hypothetical protein
LEISSKIQIFFIAIKNKKSHAQGWRNIPSVYDGLPTRIRALRNKGQSRQKAAEFWRGNGAKRNNLANGGRSVNGPVMCRTALLIILLFHFAFV